MREFHDGVLRAIPKGGLSVSDFCDNYRYLHPMRSSRAGKWNTSYTPYLKEILDNFNNPAVRQLVFMASSQIGKTEVLSCLLCYIVAVDPSPTLLIFETEDKGRAFMKESFFPMIEATPILKSVIQTDQKQEDSTLGFVKYPGGFVSAAYATSAATLSSRPCRYILCDEVDAWKSTVEGSPLRLAMARMRTFHGAKSVLVSSPRLAETSLIKPIYDNGSRGRYYVPCPQCKEFITLDWKDRETRAYRLIFDPENLVEATYACPANGCVIDHHDKEWMLANGRWQHENEHTDVASYALSELYSPFPGSTWLDVARNFLEAKRSITELQAFVNTSLGEVWAQDQEEIQVGNLPERCEEYDADIPAGVILLTAGVDVQSSPQRLEYEIIGWGLDYESWGITRGVLFGDPTKNEVWDELKAILAKPYYNADGREYRVLCAGIDSGGHYTNEVYKFCRANAGRKWYAVKGANTYGKPLISPPTKAGKPPTLLFTIGTEAAKDTFSARLKIEQPGPGFCHFPDTLNDEGEPLYDEAYFKQLVSEKPVEKYVRGVKQRTWTPIKAKERNEALDIRVYAAAALAILNPNFQALISKAKAAAEKASDEEAHDLPENKPKKAKKTSFLGVNRQKKSFIQGWR